jgi:hypothetical protein
MLNDRANSVVSRHQGIGFALNFPDQFSARTAHGGYITSTRPTISRLADSLKAICAIH